MVSSKEFQETGAKLEKWTAKILKNAYLTSEQQVDLEAIHRATQKFQSFVRENAETIDYYENADPKVLQHVRHELLNHLNIIAGFTRLLVKTLPDNLLLEMATIRQISDIGQNLIDTITEMR
jgi:hypothetical protein